MSVALTTGEMCSPGTSALAAKGVSLARTVADGAERSVAETTPPTISAVASTAAAPVPPGVAGMQRGAHEVAVAAVSPVVAPAAPYATGLVRPTTAARATPVVVPPPTVGTAASTTPAVPPTVAAAASRTTAGLLLDTPAAAPVAVVVRRVAVSAVTPAETGSVPPGAAATATVPVALATSSTASTEVATAAAVPQDAVAASRTACVDTAVDMVIASGEAVGVGGTAMPPAVAVPSLSTTAATSSVACLPRNSADVQAAEIATRSPAEYVAAAATAMAVVAESPRAAAPPSAPSTVAPDVPSTAAEVFALAGTVTGSSTDVGVPIGTTTRQAVPALPQDVSEATSPVTALATTRGIALRPTPVTSVLPAAASSMTTTPTSTSTGTGVVPTPAGALPTNVATTGQATRAPPVAVVQPPGTEVTTRSTECRPVPDAGDGNAPDGDDTQLPFEDDTEGIQPCTYTGVHTVAREYTEADEGSRPLAAQGRPPVTSAEDDLAALDAKEVSESVSPGALGPALNPKDGVYALKESTRAQIATLLRTLFVVQNSSDKSIMPFLGVVHYLMGFSALVGVVSLDDRSAFFDALLAAFEKPVSMKFFMEEAFQCGPQGLHVGGRTRPLRHVAGQPQGLQEDVLRARINKDNVKVQWIARRLSLRQRINIHPGARSVVGGLSHSDRDTVVKSLSRDGVSSKLRERGCIVRYAKVGAADRKPLSLTFQWDSSSTWFPDGLEADLVSNLKDVLLKATPVAYKDCDPHKPRAPRLAIRSEATKRPGAGEHAVEPGRDDKRAKRENHFSSSRAPPTRPAHACSKCGQTDNVGASLQPEVVSTALEHWSADVCQSEDLPHGGHVLAIALPIDMDAGPGGRQSVKGVLAKMSKSGASPCTYSLFVSCGERVPDADAEVRGAMYASSDSRDAATAPLSHDILRSVCAHMSQRLPAAGPSQAGSRPVGPGEASGVVRLSVRAAARPTLRTHRFDFTSEFELQTKGELVQRIPGRVIIFWPGIDPVPVGGAFTL